MLKSHYLLAVFWLAPCLSVVVAQTPSPPPPKEPLIHRLPSFASWTLTYKYKSDEKSPEAGRAPGTPPSKSNPDVFTEQLMSVTVTKTGKVWREQKLWSGGTQTELWIYKNIRAGILPGLQQIVVIPFSQEKEDSPDYRRNDFEGLGWVSLAQYKGIRPYLGKPAYVFESDSPPTGDKSEPKQVAILALDTQLPLYSREAGTECTYTYNPPPTMLQVPPDNYMKIFKRTDSDLKELQHIPSPP